MKKVLFGSFLFILILVGCSDEGYNNAIQKGLDYIGSEEYKKAEGAFELALDEKKDDVKATALLHQTRAFLEAIDALKSNDMELAIESAQEVMKETEGSEALIKKAEEIVLKGERVNDLLAETIEKYEFALKQYEEKEFEKAEKAVHKLLDNDMDYASFQNVKKDILTLQEKIETAIAEEKAAITTKKATNTERTDSHTNILTVEEAMKEIEKLWESWEWFGPYTEIDYVGTEPNNGIDYHFFYVSDAYYPQYPMFYYRVNASNGEIHDYSDGIKKEPSKSNPGVHIDE